MTESPWKGLEGFWCYSCTDINGNDTWCKGANSLQERRQTVERMSIDQRLTFKGMDGIQDCGVWYPYCAILEIHDVGKFPALVLSLSLSLSVCLSVCLSLCLPVCLCLCLSLCACVRACVRACSCSSYAIFFSSASSNTSSFLFFSLLFLLFLLLLLILWICVGLQIFGACAHTLALMNRCLNVNALACI